MLDPIERESWFQAYLASGLQMAGASLARRQEARRWAKSMALIAEQFIPAYDSQPMDC